MHIQGGLARLPEALVITGMKKSTFYNRQNPLHPSFDASFPARLQLSPGTVAWPRAALYEWCAKRPHVAA
ncbi:AlpA family phage regulatory protein [Oxalobacter sp. OttesenSCG-928-P03]|nr:AlpA family phage regulatory protein [Oxalobacter sp. OttesenSCG-928-P03]